MKPTPTTITARFLQLADSLPDREVIQEGDRRLKYRDLLAAAAYVASQVRTATKAPNVGILLPNGAGFAAAFFGIALAGKTVVPLNFLLKPAEIARIIADARLDTVISAEPLAASLAGTPLKVLRIDQVLQNVRPCSLEPPKNAPDDVAVLLYTSGTTQEPRGVMQTHRNILSNIDASLRAMDVKEDDIFLGVLPLFHTFGLTCAFLLPVLGGRKVVMMQRFVPAAVAETVGRSGISIVIAVPSMYRAMVRAFAETGARPERLRLCISGGEALPTALLEEFEKVTGVPLLEGYGMTETSPVISLNLLRSPRPGTVGRPLDNFEVRIVDSDGLPLPLGSEGEICVRGDSVMKGYWRRDEETREAIDEDGWLRTGDLGKLDSEGNIAITGRLKELIISAGKNIAPAEIETVLQAHPAVSEAAVIGVPDAMRGEVPMAFVVRQTGSDLEVHELMSHCRAHLADYKRPRAIEFVETLPRSLTGKVLKRLLKRDIGARQNDENAEVS